MPLNIPSTIDSVNRIYEKLQPSTDTKVASKDEVNEKVVQLLENEKTTVPALVRIADYILGPQWRAFEPDTIRLDLREVTGDIPAVNFDKLFAAQTLFKRDTCFWDANVFENTAMPFNDQLAKPEVLQKPPVSYLAWLVEQMEVLFHDKQIDTELDIKVREAFDYEPATYVSVLAHDKGWVTLPPQLSFAKPAFERMVTRTDPDETEKLIEKVNTRLGEVADVPLETIELADDAIDKQAGKRLACEKYVRQKRDRLKKEMAILRETIG